MTLNTEPPPTIHASAVVIGGQGVLIRGLPRAGKTTLGQALIAHHRQHNRPGQDTDQPWEKLCLWVSDDRTIVAEKDGYLVARAPEAIAGRIADRQRGIVTVPFAASARLALVVDLDLTHDGPPRSMTATLLGQALPVIRLAQVTPKTADAAAQDVHAALDDAMKNAPDDRSP